MIKDSPDIKVVQPQKRQALSLVDAASSTDTLQQMAISDNRTQPVSSAFARERQVSVGPAAARIEAEQMAAVKSAYVNTDTRKVVRIASLPPTNPNQALASPQLMRSVKQAQTDILMICDLVFSQEGQKPAVWVHGWERTLHKAFKRVIGHDKPSAPTLNTVKN